MAGGVRAKKNPLGSGPGKLVVLWVQLYCAFQFRKHAMPKTSDLMTADINAFTCEPDVSQSFYWDGQCQGLGVRVTRGGVKRFIFEGRVRFTGNRIKLRITIGDVRAWSVQQAREVAKQYQRMVDQGLDPRDYR